MDIHGPGDLLDVFRGGPDSVDLFDIDSLADLIDTWEGAEAAALDVKPIPATTSGGAGSSGQSAAPMVDFNRVSRDGHPDSKDNGEGSDGGGRNGRKKRTRNEQQMEHNRVAQQKYRERKKHENSGLQAAVDLLTAELAVMKAFEIRAAKLEASNAALAHEVMAATSALHSARINGAEKDATISRQLATISEQNSLLAAQQKMILDQHTKLRLQEDIITQLKDKLQESCAKAWETMAANSANDQRIDPVAVCQKMHDAVRTAIESARDQEGLEGTLGMLEKLPEALVVEICKNILMACKDMWPELTAKMEARGVICKKGPGGTCSMMAQQ